MMIKKGDKYNKLTAIRFSHRNKWNQQFWLFRCNCGKEKVICVSNVKSENTKSCGCLLKSGNRLKHKMTKTKIYNIWSLMKSRCLNKNDQSYKNYGGRGIKICQEWLNFENFYEDMGDKPQNKSLDRINNNGNYCKENCRWATRKQQNNNKRDNRLLTHRGKTQNMKQWSEELNINYSTIRTRFFRGFSVKKILNF